MIKAILFDFDGTIVDSDHVTFLEFVNLMKNYKYPVPTNEQLLKFRGLPAIEIIKKLHPQLSDQKVQEMYEFKNINADRFMPKIKLFPNVNNVLKKLSSKFKLAVVTSRRRRGVNLLLKQHHLEELFLVTITKDDVVNFKPHAEGILKAIKMLKIEMDESVYVGDAEADVATANNAGITCVLISKDKEDYGAKFHLSEIIKLPLLIKKMYEK